MEKEPAKNTEAEKLHQELTIRGQFYFKGFGMVLSDLLANIEIFTVAEATPERAQHIRHRLKTIIDLYEAIPLDQITHHPDYDLLMILKDTVNRLNTTVEKIINGEKDMKETEEAISIIHQHGQQYRARLTTMLQQLREQPGHEHDGLKAIDIIDGKIWDSAI